MKNFNRSYLPESIKYNGSEFKMNTSLSNLTNQNIKISDYISMFKSLGYKVIQVNVLSNKLRNSIDLYGLPYKPTEWLFINCEISIIRANEIIKEFKDK